MAPLSKRLPLAMLETQRATAPTALLAFDR